LDGYNNEDLVRQLPEKRATHGHPSMLRSPPALQSCLAPPLAPRVVAGLEEFVILAVGELDALLYFFSNSEQECAASGDERVAYIPCWRGIERTMAPLR